MVLECTITKRLKTNDSGYGPEIGASPDYNCEVAHRACCKRPLLDTHQWQSAMLVVGLPVTHDWFEIGCHLSPSLIQLG